MVLNASSDVEFSTSADQTDLGFAGGTGNAGPTYGTDLDRRAEFRPDGDRRQHPGLSRQQYNSLLTQIDQLAKDASFNGTNLLSSSAATNKLHITFNEKGTSNLDVQGVDATSGGLNLTSITGDLGATDGWQGQVPARCRHQHHAQQPDDASSPLRSQASTFGSNLSVVQNRQDFTKNLQQRARHRRLQAHQCRPERRGRQLPGADHPSVARHLGALARQPGAAGRPSAPPLSGSTSTATSGRGIAPAVFSLRLKHADRFRGAQSGH